DQDATGQIEITFNNADFEVVLWDNNEVLTSFEAEEWVSIEELDPSVYDLQITSLCGVEWHEIDLTDPEAISMDWTSTPMSQVETNQPIIYSVNTSFFDIQLEWWINGEMVATGPNLNWTWDQEGTHELIVIATGNSCSEQLTTQINAVNASTVPELNTEARIQWVNGQIRIESGSSGMVMITDLMGRTVHQQWVDAGVQWVLLPSVSSGQYHVSFGSAIAKVFVH
ncbi:MAG: hypothetical protein AAF193_11705, partial [Bacteroidota bacterium]